MAKSVAVAGKGGTGKSTIAALIIHTLCANNMGPVLAVDSDPDANLGTLLGIKSVQTLGDMREEIFKQIKNFPAGMTKANYVEAGLHQVIEEANCFDLITMGRSEGASCYCFLNNLIRKFCDDLSPSYAWTVIDNEAGLEHISRRTTRDIDALLIIITENPLSFDSARKIKELCTQLKNRINNLYLVSNIMRPQRIEDMKKRIEQLVAQLGIEHLCELPFNPELDQIIYKGESFNKLKDSAIIKSIKNIIDKIGGNNANT